MSQSTNKEVQWVVVGLAAGNAGKHEGVFDQPAPRRGFAYPCNARHLAQPKRCR